MINPLVIYTELLTGSGKHGICLTFHRTEGLRRLSVRPTKHGNVSE